MLNRCLALSLFVLMMGCPDPSTPAAPGDCNGHPVGSSFPAADGCNTCVCEASGASCTEIDCGDPDAGAGAADAGVTDTGEAPADAGTPGRDTGGVVEDVGASSTDAGGGGPQACGTRGADPCPEGTFCQHEIEANCGNGDVAGICTPFPEDCNRRLAWVCGCDGESYTNACEAARAGVSVAAIGACDAGEEGCRNNGDCDRGQYCEHPLSQCGALGECQQRPEACAGIYEPVCGCDGENYGNACEAAAAGVSLAAMGTCSDGCQDNGECGRAQYCARPIAQCGAAGSCEVRPQACAEIYDPVCGCDSQTYGNACAAASAGVNVAANGACAEGGGGGDACDMERPCSDAFYCDRPDEQCGAEGTCVVRPDLCNRRMQPVCGCDGQNYNNPCEARSGGTSVAYAGNCR